MPLYGVGVAVIALGLYLVTAQRDVGFWDTGEMDVVPWIFGIAHPTGFPAFVLLGGAFAHAIPFGSVAWRLSAFTSLAVVVAACALYVTAARVTGAPAIAAAGALLFVSAETVWEHATRAEVHGLALCFTTVAFWLSYEWDCRGDRRFLLGAAAAFGLALATHPVALWALPGLVVLTLGTRRPPWQLALTSIALCLLCAVVPYAYLPIRSAAVLAARRDPTLALGLPPGMPFWDYAHPATLQNFAWLVGGRQFATGAGLAAYLQPRGVPSTAAHFGGFVVGQLGVAGGLLAVVGVIDGLRRRPVLAASILLFGAAGIPFALGYAEEADKARYLLTALWTAALLAALGAAALARFVAARRRTVGAEGSATVVAVLVLCLAGAHAYANRNVIAIDADRAARAYIAATYAQSSARAVIVTPWVYAPPLAYAEYVQHAFGRRVIVTAVPGGLLPQIAAWSRERCVIVVGPRAVPALPGITLVTRSREAPYIFVVTSGRPHACAV